MSKAAMLVCLVAGLVLVPVATASAPVFTPPEPIPDFTDTACGFDINVHTSANGEVTKEFSDGHLLITGKLRTEVSANEKTISLNISGPATISFAPDGSAFLFGRGLGVGDFVTDAGVRFLQVAGPVHQTLDGSVPPVQGHVLLDLCTALS